MSQEEQPPAPQLPSPHPLQTVFWAWLIAAGFIAIIGGVIVHSCIFPSAALLERLPKGDPGWIHFWSFGLAGLGIAAAYVWFWHRLAVKRNMSRGTWRIGVALIFSGMLFLILTHNGLFAFGLLIVLVLWLHGHTRQHFDTA
jgi:hypothetical protein